MNTKPRKSRSQNWILVGLVLGFLAGLLANYLTGESAGARSALENVVDRFIHPVGIIFLRLLFMTVIPLVFSSLALGVYGMGDLKELGRIGLKTLVFILGLSAAGVATGYFLVNSIEPGLRIEDHDRERFRETMSEEPPAVVKDAEEAGKGFGLTNIINTVIPQNPVEAAANAFQGQMLGVFFFAVIFGVALRASGSRRIGTVVAFLEGIYDVSFWLIGMALRLAPVGVAALVFSMASVLGISALVVVGSFVLTVLLGLAIHIGLVFPLILTLLCRRNPLEFFLRIREPMVTAFSTASSNATLPTSLRACKLGLGVPPRVANFVVTLGATFNQTGTALFEVVSIFFLAQLLQVPLSVEDQVLVVVFCILSGVGTPGIPGGIIPVMLPVMVSVNLPSEAIVIILGVDRLLDMCRTTLNVVGDLMLATFVARGEEEAH